jgi:glycosyltransferase involved in cell wall biosynthesis
MGGLTDKINVLFVIMQMGMGGSERLVHNLAMKIDRYLFNPSVAWFYGDRILKEFRDLEIPLYHIPKKRSIDISTMHMLGNIIKQNDISIVNAHHFMSMVYSFYGSKVINSKKLVYTEHSEWEIEKISQKWQIIGKYLMSRVDGVVGVTEAVSKQLQKTFQTARARTFTIQNGVDFKAFRDGNGSTSLRMTLGLADHEKVIGIVANFRSIKNHIFLLRAFAELVKEHNDVRLLLVGQGFPNDPENSEQGIRDFVKGKALSGKVLLLGYRSDIPDLLNIMDIFCLTSHKEGLPISLIEAMAAGLPVVGTDVEGIRDVIMPNKNGFLVPIGDVMGLKNALHTLIQNESLRQKFGQKSGSLARDTYSLERCVKQYQDLFSSLMKK